MTIEDDVALLALVPTFSALGREALRVLAIGSENRILEEGEILFREGEVADCGYVIEEGALSARKVGGAPVLFERGALLGEHALLVQTRRAATVSAAEASSVMRIPRPLFLKTLQGYPEGAERLRQSMAARNTRLLSDLDGIRQVLARDVPLPTDAPDG